MPNALDRFRRLTGEPRGSDLVNVRPPIPPRERWLVALLLANIVWLAFALGGVRLWGESTAAVLALATLFLLPRWRSYELPGRRPPAVQLLTLPLFWCGLLLFIYFWIESWNLAWVWTTGPRGAPMLIQVEPRFAWLPAGIQTPLEEKNPFRSMLFYGIPWLSVCSAWAGLQSRRANAALIHGIALTGILYAIIALYQYFYQVEKILGLFETVPSRLGSDIPFWGTLINGNHAAYYLILINGLCMGLFLNGWQRDIRKFRSQGGIWVLYFAAAIVVTVSVLMAQSRGAIGVLAFQWFGFLAICSVFFVRRFGKVGLILPFGVLVVMIAVVIGFIRNPEVFESQRQDWIKTFDLMQNPELEARYYMWKISRDMIADAPLFGHGAGSWRYTHLRYLPRYPDFRTEKEFWGRHPTTGERVKRKRIVWFQNAHVDLAEYVVEWGYLGASLPMLAIFWLLYQVLRARAAVQFGTVVMLMGVFLVWLGAAIEFHFRIPLVLLTWCLAFVAVVRLTVLQSRHVD